ncbi:26098_t:CDS:2 [Gigaspora margarita]|uniref:26098_t:CDS:1 n=1 Tax=Gigaspora margarita TaxID=4874 RepID=A0ABN7V1E1_GIGMA|nr:26098_t:CDS:2 [Gigaspora margarita]
MQLLYDIFNTNCFSTLTKESSNASIKKRSNIAVKTFSMFELLDMLMFEEKKLVYMIFIKNHLQKNDIYDIFIDGKLIIGRFNSIDKIFAILENYIVKLIKNIEKTINKRNIRKLKFEKRERINEYIVAIKRNKGLKEAIEIKDLKKDPAIRTNELRKAISPALINYAKENTAEMLSNTYMTQIFCESLLCGEAAIEEKISILENIPSLIGDISNENNIMLTYANRFLKILVQGQFQRLDNGQYKDKQDKRVELHFAPLLFKSIKKDIIFYACNASASFVILALLQDKETGSAVYRKLNKLLQMI